MTDDVIGLLEQHLPARGDDLAVVYGHEQWSYAALSLDVSRVVTALAADGIGAGDRVALWLPNTPAYLIICLACARVGAVVVAVNTRFRSVEVEDIVRRSDARLLVMWPGFRGIDFPGILRDVDAAALRRLRGVWWYGEEAAVGEEDVPALPASLGHCAVRPFHDALGSAPSDLRQGGRDAPANIFTTSGTTKAPKFVLHRQASIADHALDLARALTGMLGAGGLLQALPLCGVFGYTQAMLALAAGRPMVVMAAFDAAAAVAAIDRHQVRYLNATDDMVDALLAADDRPRALPTVRCCGFGAFNRPPEETAALAEARGLRLVGLYGMSELQALLAMQDPEAPLAQRAPGGGRLLSRRAEVRVRNVDSGELCAPGESGELEFKAPSMFVGYDGDPEATAGAITADGFLRTGDLGFQTGPDQFVYQTRMGDVLRLSGFLVSPAEIESRLLGFDGVTSCQVVAVEWQGRSTAVGFVVMAHGRHLDEPGARAHCAAGLARFKVPVRIVALAEFPTTRSANGTKVQRNRLRQMALSELAAP